MLNKMIAVMLAVAVVVCPMAGVAMAGEIRGPQIGSARAEAYSSVTYHLTFDCHELALIRVIGDGDSDLDLFVYDGWGNLVASDTDCSDVCVVGFTPSRVGCFRVEVRNLGGIYNRFTIETN